MTDPLYIKMILALPEDFFEGWQWKMGDKYMRSLKNNCDFSRGIWYA